jgi:DNA-binding response OmpR family regulator
MAYLLIVDDDEDFASVAAKILRHAGHDVQIELDLKGAAASIARRRPDLVILDVMFPENDSAGFEFARELRQSSQAPGKMAILMLTAINTKFALGFSEVDIDGVWLPVEAFLEKPIDLDVLREKVSGLLGGSGSAGQK